MKWRKVVGWLLFALGIPFFFIVVTISKEITGNYTLGMFVGALVMAGGWYLAHSKKKVSDKPSTQQTNVEKEKHGISTTELQEEEYKHSVLQIHGNEQKMTSDEKPIEPDEQMLRGQELLIKSGWITSQADHRVNVEDASRFSNYAFPPWMRKIAFVFLSLALVAVIVYGFVITGDRNTLNTELESVQSELTSTELELGSTKQTLASTQLDLDSTQTELSSTKESLASTRLELTSTNRRLSSVQNELGATKTDLDTIEAKLKLYEDTMGIKIFSGVEQPPLQGASPIKLVNNPAATDPSWEQLISFLRADPTDDEYWEEGIFVSGDFAQMLHNNAEATGIRAALVGVFFEGKSIGHGLNAFKTSDKGLVYVDSTGPTLSQSLDLEWDKIAYAVKGKEYGIVSLGQNTPLDYASYEKMKADTDSYAPKLEAYNQEVAAYNSAYSRYVRLLENPSLPFMDSIWNQRRQDLDELLAANTQKLFELIYGRTFEEEEEYLEEQREWLNSIRAQLKKVWEPMGIVESIKIYW